MIDEFEYKGIWWLPEDPENQVSGTLKFTPDKGATLDLMDTLAHDAPEIILGFSSSGKNITLNKCFLTESKQSTPGLSTSSFYAHIAFVGAHFQTLEDIKFKRLSMHYLYLDEWVNISGFDIRTYPSEKGVDIKYKLPDSIEVIIDERYKVFIDFRADFSGRSRVQKDASIKQKTYIGIENSEEKPLDECLKIMYYIENFLTLGIAQPVYPMAIEGKTETSDKPVEIHYSVPDIPIVSKPLLPHQMLFTFKDISDKFGGLLKKWFEKHEQLKPVYDLYFGTLYNPRMYLEQQFLSLIQAIEAYHRRTMKNFELPKEEHEKRIEEILSKVPQNHKKWLREKLKYSNEPSLRRRLKETFGKYLEILNNFIEDRDNFIHKVKSTRDYLTHYDQSLENQAAREEEFPDITQKLKLLMEICLLTELGFGYDEINSLLSGNRRQ